MKHNATSKPTTLQPTQQRPLELLQAIVNLFDRTNNNSAAANYARRLLGGMF